MILKSEEQVLRELEQKFRAGADCVCVYTLRWAAAPVSAKEIDIDARVISASDNKVVYESLDSRVLGTWSVYLNSKTLSACPLPQIGTVDKVCLGTEDIVDAEN